MRAREAGSVTPRPSSQAPDDGGDRGPRDGEPCPTAEDLTAFLDGGLAPPAMTALDAHAARCDRCRELLSAMARADSGMFCDLASSMAVTLVAARWSSQEPQIADEPLPAGATIGRYTVLDRIGAGGMGVVYAAHDPELNRKVALKILRAELREADGRGPVPPRLVREAQAMAQLAHPNVVAVHDIGRVGNHRFVAMELVEGQTLDQWLAEQPRSWREVVAMFLGAGQGLAAAHAAGLVHRDFKPANVLTGRDGRPRVSDFGLVQRDAPPAQTEESAAAAGAPDPRTSSRALVGTPYYMAPEQFRGDPVDARTDQFSFCVALHRALYREHPFAGATLGELADAVIEGRVRPPRHRADVPRWLGRLVLRGLSSDPAQRFPSMVELLRVLAREPRRWRHLGVGAVVLVVAAAAAAPLAYRVLGDSSPSCTEAGPTLASAWGPDRRGRVERAFSATRKPFAAAAFAEVARVLDAYTRSWTDLRVEVCEAARRPRESPDELVGLRALCLDAAASQVRALTEVFQTASAEIVERAPQAVHELADPSRCTDPQALLGPVRPPADPRERARVVALGDELARVETLHRLGRYRDALDGARALLDRARDVRYRPLEAEAQLVLGQAADASGETRVAEAALQQAALAAEAGRSDELAARALIRLMLVQGRGPGRHERAVDLAPRVTALLERLGGNVELEGALHVTLSQVLQASSEYPEAEKEGRLGLELLERRFGPSDLRVAAALEALGVLAMNRYEAQVAVDLHRRALAIRQKVVGDDHPEVATAYAGVAKALARMNQFSEARAAGARALAIREHALGPDHPDIGDALAGLGEIYLWDQRFSDALPLLHRATANALKTYGPAHAVYGRRLTTEGYALVGFKRHADALPLLREALSVLLAALGPAHAEVSFARRVLGQALFELGRYREARTEVLASLATQEQLFGQQHPLASMQYRLLGEIDLKLGDPAQAITAIERARALADAGGLDRLWHADLDFALARALAAARRDPGRARALAESAAAAFAGDPQSDHERREIESWLARNRPGRSSPPAGLSPARRRDPRPG